jgi:hypothetical protein
MRGWPRIRTAPSTGRLSALSDQRNYRNATARRLDGAAGDGQRVYRL